MIGKEAMTEKRFEQIHTYFSDQKEWVTKLLSDLCAIPSESGHESEAQAFLAAELGKIEGLSVEKSLIDNSLKDHPQYASPVKGIDYSGRYNMIVRKTGEPDGKTLGFNTHIDVVPPSAKQEHPYEPSLDDNGVLWARGSCDAKGQIAAFALFLKAACELSDSENSVIGHIVVEEEIGGNGTVAVLDASPGFKADAVVNMEPTGLRLSPSIRGAIWFDMTFSGIAGHAGSSQNTKSATDKAIGAVALLKQYHAQLLERSRDYGLFKGFPNPMPLTIGIFQAGVWPAMVPDKARIGGVLGFLPNTDYKTVIAEIKELFGRSENGWIADGMSMEFVYRHDAVETSPDHPFVTGMARACERCGVTGEPTAMTASSDGIYYQELGIPVMAFGPGLIADAHSLHECVSMDDVVKAAEILYLYFMNM